LRTWLPIDFPQWLFNVTVLREFMEFLNRLRHAKDKSEFDQFMADRGVARKVRGRNRKPSDPLEGTTGRFSAGSADWAVAAATTAAAGCRPSLPRR
jgi:hypothetical protein